ncbi:MAG: hypothetical protein ABSH12_00375 [Endomicrobiales bacterium]
MKVARGQWLYPVFAPIAHKHGKYSRMICEENGKLMIIWIQRYKFTHPFKGVVTFSLLPIGVVPYWRYTLAIITKVVVGCQQRTMSLGETLGKLFMDMENASDELLALGESQMYRFKKLYKTALTKYTIWKGYGRSEYTLERFVRHCGGVDGKAAALSVAYYEDNGGQSSNSQFLFGTASQFRRDDGTESR